MKKEEMATKPKSVKKNYIYNLIYQLFLLLVPIVVTPYLARTITGEGQGQYAYTYAYVTYFTLFAALGFNYYAQRLIARDREDKHRQSLDFFEIFIARLIPTGIALIVYFILTACNVYQGVYNLLMLMNSFQVIAVMFDITFLLQGNEEFGRIAIRNVIVKAISIACIFIFVKSINDVWIYALIQSLTILVSNISLWVYAPRMIEKVSLKELHPLRHLWPTFMLFIPTIAISLYTSLDKTLIRQITGLDSQTGNYENAEKIVKMSLTVIVSLVAVYAPRNTLLYEQGKYDELKKITFNLSKFVLFIGLPMMFGIIAIAPNFLPYYLGDEYGAENIQNTVQIMQVLSPIIVIIGFGNVLGGALLIPIGKDVKYTIAITSGAIINICLNLILIRYYQAVGAAIATIVAESTVSILQLVFARKYVNIFKVILSSWKIIISSVLMFAATITLGLKLNSSIPHTLLIIVVGVGVYGLMLLILREKLLLDNLKKVLNKFFKTKENNK